MTLLNLFSFFFTFKSCLYGISYISVLMKGTAWIMYSARGLSSARLPWETNFKWKKLEDSKKYCQMTLSITLTTVSL